ncbi:uncharacterized protein AB675_1245 [Cyphellophora attinorum]|uniref:F-box domain-containing protein n=1 Tax=Cyphellophora attinorum TaxID=1664694 RepID=A0A0N1NXS5_9EURO|nr:uncharacterized protein AB675_1245 [Phialophora attinorum]KPI35765.1 hypothetical protein AB675_1245 [Phialophora attinorum]
MSDTLSAPTWDKPHPRLDSMPVEIFEKIIGFTIPDNLDLCISNMFHRKMTSICWSPDWVSTLRIVSRRFRQVAQVAMVDRCGFHFTLGDRALRESLSLPIGREVLRSRIRDWLKTSAELPTAQSTLAAAVNKTMNEDFEHVQKNLNGWARVFTMDQRIRIGGKFMEEALDIMECKREIAELKQQIDLEEQEARFLEHLFK